MPAAPPRFERPFRPRFVLAFLAAVPWMSLAWISSAMAQTRVEFCGLAPPSGFDQAPNRPHTGRYVNPTYGYALRIPAPLVAYADASGPERGVGIVLSWTPRSFVRIDASYDVFYDLTAAGVHRSDLNAIRVHDQLVTDESGTALLDGERAGRYLTRLRCSGDPSEHVIEVILVVRRREVYRLQLQTSPERLQDDQRVLEQIARSWRWQPLR
jgi:hypothetical protein